MTYRTCRCPLIILRLTTWPDTSYTTNINIFVSTCLNFPSSDLSWSDTCCAGNVSLSSEGHCLKFVVPCALCLHCDTYTVNCSAFFLLQQCFLCCSHRILPDRLGWPHLCVSLAYLLIHHSQQAAKFRSEIVIRRLYYRYAALSVAACKLLLNATVTANLWNYTIDISWLIDL